MKHIKKFNEKVDQKVIDTILDKITSSGYDSLTTKEKEILDNADNPNYYATMKDLSTPSSLQKPKSNPTDGLINSIQQYRGGEVKDESEDDDYYTTGAIEPNDAEFDISTDDLSETGVTLWVSSISNPDYDDIRTINHPDFDKLWGNMCENVFEMNPQSWIDRNRANIRALQNLEEAKQWCISIGMKYTPGLAGTVGG